MVTTGEASLFVALGSLVASGAYVVSTAQRTPASPRQLAVCVLVQILINLGVSRLNFPWLHVHISEYPRWAWWVTRHSHHHHHHSSSSSSLILIITQHHHSLSSLFCFLVNFASRKAGLTAPPGAVAPSRRRVRVYTATALPL